MTGSVISVWIPDEQIDGDDVYRLGVIAPEGVLSGTIGLNGSDELTGELERISSWGMFIGPGEHQFVLTLSRRTRYIEPLLRVVLEDGRR